ncbi:unnamed protein product [Scytosiphon promiscuus]
MTALDAWGTRILVCISQDFLFRLYQTRVRTSILHGMDAALLEMSRRSILEPWMRHIFQTNSAYSPRNMVVKLFDIHEQANLYHAHPLIPCGQHPGVDSTARQPQDS